MIRVLSGVFVAIAFGSLVRGNYSAALFIGCTGICLFILDVAIRVVKRRRAYKEHAKYIFAFKNEHINLFISYSRKQFYYAESLALCLQFYNIPTWFDVQKISPGVDWDQSIQEGLNSCTGLILIASPESLASEHVRREWEAALKAHKPVYVVMFTYVKLPPELEQQPIIDGRFLLKRHRRLQMINLLRTYSTDGNLLLKANKFHLLLRISFWSIPLRTYSWISMLIPLIALSIMSVATILPLVTVSTVTGPMSLKSVTIILAIVLNWVFVAISGLTWSLWYSSRRKSSYLRFGVFFFVSFFSVLFVVGLNPIYNPQFVGKGLAESLRSQYEGILLFAFGLFFLGWIIGPLMLIRMKNSLSGLWWSSSGSLAQKERHDLNQDWVDFPSSPDVSPSKKLTYRLQYTPMDKAVADGVLDTFSKYRELEFHPDGPVDYEIVLLTHHTPQAWLNIPPEKTSHIIFVICTNISVPNTLEEFYRYQWFDYRKRSPEQLSLLVSELLGKNVTTSGYSFSMLPEQLQHPLLPSPVAQLTAFFRIVAALNLVISLFALLTISQHLIYIAIFPASSCLAYYLFRRANMLENSQMTNRHLMIDLLIAFINTVLLNSITILMIFKLDSAGNLALVDFLVFLIGIGSALMVFLTLILFLDRKQAYALRTWLPCSTVNAANDNDIQTLSTVNRPWYVILPYLFFALEIAVFLIASS